jgi:hypothetical protein
MTLAAILPQLQRRFTMQRRIASRVGTFLVLFCAPLASYAADILHNLPIDSLGFVVVRNLASTDAKILKLLRTVEGPNLGPLMFLQAATGVNDGLDPQGDLLFAILPGAGAADSSPQFAVWLPARDYDAIITSLGGAAGQQIVGVTIANEDVLIARHGGRALVMDPDQRERMERMLAAEPNPPPQIAAWNQWIDANDITAVALPNGVRTIVAWAAAAKPASPQHPQAGDDLFGADQTPDPNDPFTALPNTPGSSNEITTMLRTTIRKWTITSRQLTKMAIQARLLGCAVRLDETGNLRSALRLLGADRVSSTTSAPATPQPPALYEGGNFVLHGSGDLPPPLASIAAGAYVRSLIEDLKTEEGILLGDRLMGQLQLAVERAGTGVLSAVVLTQPGDKQEGVYTNEFLVVRAASAAAFADNAKEVMRLWNSMNRDAQSEMRLLFDVEEVKLGDRTATQYSVDIAAADGAPELPEIRQAMEQLFGPGGKLRVWIVPVDEENVLLATATPDQVAAALQVLDRKQTVDWSQQDIAPINRLLPAEANWRLFFSPHHHNIWHRREMHAITGPVIGGPIVREFPPSPPVGFAGGVHGSELWIDAAVPAETMKAAIAYLKKKQR